MMQLALPNVPALYLVRLLYTRSNPYVCEEQARKRKLSLLYLLTYLLTCTYCAYAAASASVRDFRK